MPGPGDPAGQGGRVAGLFMMWQNPSWATMQVARGHHGIWAGFVLLYAGGTVVAALLGRLAGWPLGLAAFAAVAGFALLTRRSPVRLLYGLVGVPKRHWKADLGLALTYPVPWGSPVAAQPMPTAASALRCLAVGRAGQYR